jgi:NAD(P)H-flavin reductase
VKEIAGAVVVENREVARGMRWLVLEAEADPPEVYEPGHIVALYVPDPGGRWSRHPYTVCWCEGPRIGLLYRVVPHGRTTPFLAMMGPGETVRLGGRFGEPVHRLVLDAGVLIGVATGSGLGPLRGYARTAGLPVVLLAGFRGPADIPVVDALAGGTEPFTWMPTVTHPDEAWGGRVGRVNAHVGDALAAARAAAPGLPVHWHLVGNGGMVTDVRAGLLAAGVQQPRITTEIYHARGSVPDEAAAAEIAALLRG